MISFVVYCRPQPQGSMRGFAFKRKSGKLGVSLVSDNPKMKPYRREVSDVAMLTAEAERLTLPVAGRHVPVRLTFNFYFLKPTSVPKKRSTMVVKPDIDKLQRSTIDSLTGILFHDDAQIVEVQARKHYGEAPERVEVTMDFVGSPAVSA